jgi:hypothetical protein
MLNQLGDMLRLIEMKDVQSEIIATAKGKYQYEKSFIKNILKIWLLRK